MQNIIYNLILNLLKNVFTAGPVPSSSSSAPATAAPATAAPATAAPATAAPTNAAPTNAAPQTAAPATAAPTTAAVVTVMVSFRSRLSTFTSDLMDSSSEAFKSRSTMIKGQVSLALRIKSAGSH